MRILGTHKICKMCNETKEINMFNHGVRTCKDCYKPIRHKYYIDNNKQKHPLKNGRPKKKIVDDTL